VCGICDSEFTVDEPDEAGGDGPDDEATGRAALRAC
jgi:hypothetical protein